MNNIEMGKKYKTTGGHSARVLCVDRKTHSDYPVIALLTGPDGFERIETFTAEGIAESINSGAIGLIESTPWSLLNRGDSCIAWNDDFPDRTAQVFMGERYGRPVTYGRKGNPYLIWDNCIPFAEEDLK